MITALFAGLLLLALGILAKGFFAHLMVLLVAWLAKNGLLLGLLKTRVGRRMVRNVRLKAYSHAGQGEKRRKIYRVFKLVEHLEGKAMRAISKMRMAGAAALGVKKRPVRAPSAQAGGAGAAGRESSGKRRPVRVSES
nr:Putative sulfate permease (Magnetosome protein MamW) [uncultured bacterium]